MSTPQDNQKDQLDRIADKQDKIAIEMGTMAVDLAKIEVTLERNTDSLVAHMQRTELAEARLDKIEDIFQFFKGAAWVLGALLTGIGVLVTLLMKFIIFN